MCIASATHVFQPFLKTTILFNWHRPKVSDKSLYPRAFLVFSSSGPKSSFEVFKWKPTPRGELANWNSIPLIEGGVGLAISSPVYENREMIQLVQCLGRKALGILWIVEDVCVCSLSSFF